MIKKLIFSNLVLETNDTNSKRIKKINFNGFKSLNCLIKTLFFIFIFNPCLIQAKKPLYTAGFFPLSGEKADLGTGILPAVQLALDDVNENEVIPGYKLDLVGNDTECNAAVGMKIFFDMIFAAPKKYILFGDACPTVTDPIAKASRFFHLIQLSYADTHPMYTSDSYPNLFRVTPSQSAFNKARVALLKHFNWQRVGTIYKNSPRYSLPHSRLLTELDLTNIDIAYTQSLSDEVPFELIKIKEKDVRIILGNFGESWARKIFCQAYQHGIYGRKYQWIIAGEYSEFWWTKIDRGINCTRKELLAAIEGYIITDVLPLTSGNIITASGMTASEYEIRYNSLRGADYSKFHGYAYDGLWTIALAMQRVQKKLKTVYTNTTLEDFKYRDAFWSKLFRNALNETSFIGVTGNVSFFNNERRGSMILKQMQSGREVKIGEYHGTNDYLDLSVGKPISWGHNNVAPLDRTIKEIVSSRVNLTLFIVISIFAILGILLALVFLIMNIKYRKQRYIKMSSPYLNNLIIIGCILTYTSVILLGLDSRLLSEKNFPYICTARAWVLMTGFTLAFGSMFSKTYRVHAIFTNIKLNKKVIKDYKLFMVVGILVFIDVATLTTWQIVDPFYRQTNLGTPETTPENEDILIVPQMEYCQSKRMTIFLGSIYVYKGLLMAFGIFLAWETRHVSIPALNDSKYIGMSVYNVVIMCVIGAGLSVVLKDQQNAAFLIISIFIIFCSTATLCLVFVPKLIELKRNPNMDERRTRPTLKPFKKSRRESDEFELLNKIKNLTETNVRQRQKLKEKTYELEALMFRLRQINAEIAEDDAEIEQNKNQNIPELETKNLLNKQLMKPIDHNRLNTNQLKKQIFVVVGEESSSRSNDRETSFITLSASASFVSLNENCAIYAHCQQTNQNNKFQQSTLQQKFVSKKIEDTAYRCSNVNQIAKQLLIGNSDLTDDIIVLDQNLIQQHNSCPELHQMQQLKLLNDDQCNNNISERLMLSNTTNIKNNETDLDSLLSNCSNYSFKNEALEKDIENQLFNKNYNKERFKILNKKKELNINHRNNSHVNQSAKNKNKARCRMVKAISQIEPLSLIEKVREVRFAVQRSLKEAENEQIIKLDKVYKQKNKKKKKSFSLNDSNNQFSQKQFNLPSSINNLIKNDNLWNENYLNESKDLRKITYANENIFKNKSLDEDLPLSCDYLNNSSSSSSPSTAIGQNLINTKIKEKRKKKLKSKKQVKNSKIDNLKKNQSISICHQHSTFLQRRAVSLDTLNSQLYNCKNISKKKNCDDQDTEKKIEEEIKFNISTILSKPFNFTSTNLYDNIPKFPYSNLNNNRLTNSITTNSISTVAVCPKIDFFNKKLNTTNTLTQLTNTFSSSPSIKCDIVEYL
uniref:Gamma-aminobutyric acid type B receptor n=1 Tax=Polyphagotarsonemus latus TaxID=1204166 RepID=A0AAN0LJ33_9ACAR